MLAGCSGAPCYVQVSTEDEEEPPGRVLGHLNG